MLCILTSGTVIEVRHISRDDIGRIIAVWGVLDGTTHHGVWPIDDIVEFCNR